jgi:methyl-accepting chemotaxis protein
MLILQSKFGKYLALMIGLSLTIILLVGSSALYELDKSRDTMSRLYSENMKSVDALNKIKFLMLDNRTQMRTALSNVLVIAGLGVKPELALDPESARKSAGIINSNMEAINSLWAGYFTNIVDEKENQLGKDFVGAHEKFAEQALKPIVSALKILNYQDTKEHARVALDLLTVVNADIDKLVDFQFTSAQSKNIAAGSRFETLRITFAIFMGGVLFLMGWLGHFILRGYSRSLTAVLNICEAMERGEFDNVIEEKGSDEFSQIATALKSSQAEINRFSEESMLIKLALDKASVGIIIVNNDRIITYINAKAILFLRHVEADIRKLVPQFSADHVMGMSIDVFHKAPAHQAAMLGKLVDTVEGEFKMGDSQVKIIATAIFDDKNERLGTVGEWHDRTAQVSSEYELSEMINQVITGNLTRRINHSQQSGFFKETSLGFNTIIEVVDAWMKEFGRIFSSIEVGDLTQRIDDNGDDTGSFIELGRNANNTIDNLHKLIEKITWAAEAIASASSQIAEGNTDLSQRTEEQASSLEETASSMEQFAAAVKNNAENSKQANQLAVATFEVAAKGGVVVNEMVQTMVFINESSNKIVDIISVMDSIAFQINILALNAAVEAARAGEQGRGFAVVASEVRSLAHKSADAAKEIKLLISDSVKKVESGSKLASEVGSTMAEIISSVNRVTDIINEISAASSEQSIGIDQVNQAIMQMDGVTQQNASLVEESAAAAAAMAQEAQALMKMVGEFKLTKADSSPPSKGKAARPATQSQAKAAPIKVARSKYNQVPASAGSDWDEF